MDTIYTKNAPDAIGPYSQAVRIGDMLYTSGQIAINPASGQVEADTIEGQTEQVMQNLAALLEEAGRPQQDLSGRGADLFVTPQDIDQRVTELGRIVGYGITLALQRGLTLEDVTGLLG